MSSWNYVLKPYLGSPGATTPTYKKLMQCESNPWPYPTGSFPSIGGPVTVTGYAMNTTMFPETFRCSGGYTCANSPTSQFKWNKRVNLSEINHASGVALLGEFPVCDLFRPNPWGTSYLPYSGYGISSVSATNCGTGAFTVTNPWLSEWRMATCNAWIAAWHGLSMNALLADGHVVAISKSALIDYSCQQQAGGGVGPNGSPGGIFWTDGRGLARAGSAWYADQFPGAPYPE